MQVILLEKVVNLGNLGDVVRVKDGYARNFLIPQPHGTPCNRRPPWPNSKSSAPNWKKQLPKNWLLPRRKARS